MSADLKPCPFCKTHPVLVSGPGVWREHHKVSCTTPACYCATSPVTFPGAAQAVEYWNEKCALAQAEAAEVPEGYVLAPIEPTDAMVDAGCAQHQCEPSDPWHSAFPLSEGDASAVYKAMIAAASHERASPPAEGAASR